MSSWISKSALMSGMFLVAVSAQANLINNGGFETCSGTPAQTDPSQPKTSFTSCAPTGWTGGGNLTYVDAPGTADGTGYLPVYGPFPATSPTGGNFVQADGNPNYSGAFSQTVNGLVVGASYALTFWQAAGQQTGFNGITTEQWKVNFGSAPQQVSTLMTNQNHGVVPWNQQVMIFTANAASQVLTFMAWGDGGSTVNLPPIVFLDGVSLNKVPEPAGLALVAVGLVALGAGRRRKAGAQAA